MSIDGKQIHDYTYDMRCILSRPIGQKEYRKELEIEIMYKWVLQNYNADHSGIASFIQKCSSRVAIIKTFNDMRLEIVAPGDVIVFQDSFNRPEDGQFTILSGQCEALQLMANSRGLLQLGEYHKKRDFDKCKEQLQLAKKTAVLLPPAGFGEVATLTNTQLLSSVRAGSMSENGALLGNTELIIVPKVIQTFN